MVGGSTRGCKADVDGGGGGGGGGRRLFFGRKNTRYIQSTYVCKYNRIGIACSRYRREEIQAPPPFPPQDSHNRTQQPGHNNPHQASSSPDNPDYVPGRSVPGRSGIEPPRGSAERRSG